MIQQFGCVFEFCYVLNDYGFRPATLIGLNNQGGYYPKDSDVYNPNQPHNGNTNYGNPNYESSQLDWISQKYATMDLRLFYADKGANAWKTCRWVENTPLPGL